MKNNKWIKWGVISVIALGCLLLDQISKLIAIKKLVEFDRVEIIKNFFYFTLCYNTGGAWSIFSNNTWLLVIISLIALGFIIYTLTKSKNKFYLISASLFIGGLLGNLVDRVFRGKVTDFFDFVIFNYDYPVFNVADIFIVISAILIVCSILFEGKKDGNKDSE